MITVFFDDRCSLCSKEIEHYKKIASDGFNWVPISSDGECLQKYGIDTADALKLLHVVDNSGTVHRGVDSFVVIWSNLDRWRYLAVVASLPLVRQMLRSVYAVFAEWRFKRLPYCKMFIEN
tara:strand:+ start:285 stop:647 length:363 start_codon:yes stop_codon:yes gene_type:complete